MALDENAGVYVMMSPFIIDMGSLFLSVRPNARGIMKIGNALIILGLVPVLTAQTACKPRTGANQQRVAALRAKANKGDAKAQSALGTAYFHGQSGLKQDDTEALRVSRSEHWRHA
jgi:TPR repeat protein